MATKKETPQHKSGGGIKVTLTSDYEYQNGLKIYAGKTYTVTRSFYKELNEGGYLTKKENKSKTKK